MADTAAADLCDAVSGAAGLVVALVFVALDGAGWVDGGGWVGVGVGGMVGVSVGIACVSDAGGRVLAAVALAVLGVI